MRALVLERFGALTVEQVPEIEPDADEVLIRVVATGICGSDIHGFTGENGRRYPGQVMGHETAGTVAAVGAQVGPGLAVGTKVTFNPVVIPIADLAGFVGREQHHPGKHVIGVTPAIRAAFADLVLVPVRNVVTLPDSLPVELGALVEPMAVAIHAVRRAGVAPGDAVAVVGGGPIGQCVVLALQLAGADSIVVSELSAARRELLSTLRVAAVDPLALPFAEAVQARFGRPADVTLDAVGSSASLGDALSATALGGRVCLVGMATPRIDLDAYAVSTEERTLVGSFTYSADAFQAAVDAVGSIPVEDLRKLVSLEIDPHQADEQFRRMAESADAVPGKVLVRFDR